MCPRDLGRIWAAARRPHRFCDLLVCPRAFVPVGALFSFRCVFFSSPLPSLFCLRLDLLCLRIFSHLIWDGFMWRIGAHTVPETFWWVFVHLPQWGLFSSFRCVFEHLPQWGPLFICPSGAIFICPGEGHFASLSLCPTSLQKMGKWGVSIGFPV